LPAEFGLVSRATRNRFCIVSHQRQAARFQTFRQAAHQRETALDELAEIGKRGADVAHGGTILGGDKLAEINLVKTKVVVQNSPESQAGCRQLMIASRQIVKRVFLSLAVQLPHVVDFFAFALRPSRLRSLSLAPDCRSAFVVVLLEHAHQRRNDSVCG
jgi:hypothetical protein